jgi:hypothetical protein
MKARDLFRDQTLTLRPNTNGWVISLRSADGREDVLCLSSDREEALEAIDAWMEATTDDTELELTPAIESELRDLMLETLRRMAAGEIKRGDLGVDDARLERWFEREMGQRSS